MQYKKGLSTQDGGKKCTNISIFLWIDGNFSYRVFVHLIKPCNKQLV